VKFKQAIEKVTDFHIASPLYDEKTYFKSISGMMQKQKSPIAETKKHYDGLNNRDRDDSLLKDSLCEI
jgi:hypothetical protein